MHTRRFDQVAKHQPEEHLHFVSLLVLVQDRCQILVDVSDHCKVAEQVAVFTDKVLLAFERMPGARSLKVPQQISILSGELIVLPMRLNAVESIKEFIGLFGLATWTAERVGH